MDKTSTYNRLGREVHVVVSVVTVTARSCPVHQFFNAANSIKLRVGMSKCAYF